MPRLFLFVCISLLLATAATASPAPVDGQPPCFPGAYYRKAVTAPGPWTGIEAVVVLPEIHFDPERARPAGRPLDNGSIYLGGRAGGQEIDAGLTWEIIRLPDGTVTSQGKAWRPFWRNKSWHNAPARPEFYYFPGDKVWMSCSLVEDGKLQLEVVVLERGEQAHLELAALGASAEDASTTMSAIFDAPGFTLTGPQEMKRVNGLDQYGNEGQPVKPTATAIVGAEWREVFLHRGAEKVPMTPEMYMDMRCPNPQHVKVAPVEGDPTGEKVLLQGDPDDSLFYIE